MSAAPFLLDVDEVRALSREIPLSGRRFVEVFSDVQNRVEERYGIVLPSYLAKPSRDMYHAVTPNAPYILAHIVKLILDQLSLTHERIRVINPGGMYDLCSGIGFAAQGSALKLREVIVEGDVGTYYGGLSGDHFLVHHVKGCAGRSFMDNALQGKIIVDDIADDSAAQANHGASFLFRGAVGPRLGWEQRGGSIVTLRNLPFNAGLFMAGGVILTLGSEIEAGLGPDMQGGAIYTPYVGPDTVGIGAEAHPLEPADYGQIREALAPFVDELGVRGISSLSDINPALVINGKTYLFSSYQKIVPKRG